MKKWWLRVQSKRRFIIKIMWQAPKKRRKRKTSNNDSLKRKSKGKTWRENSLVMWSPDGTGRRKSFFLRKTTVLLLIPGQSAVYLQSCSVWWRRMRQPLWIENRSFQANPVFLFLQTRIPRSNARVSPFLPQISLLLFLKSLARQMRLIKASWQTKKLPNTWTPSPQSLKPIWLNCTQVPLKMQWISCKKH